jgi:hypothetical protein
LVQGSVVWQFSMKAAERRRTFTREEIAGQPKATYKYAAGLLWEHLQMDVPDSNLFRLTTGVGKEHSKGPKMKSVVGLTIFDKGIADAYSWPDGKPIQTATTEIIRQHLRKKSTSVHVSIRKREMQTRWTYNKRTF